MGVSMRQSLKHSDHAERDFIQQQVLSARSYRSIAAALGRSVSAVSREVARNCCVAGLFSGGAIGPIPAPFKAMKALQTVVDDPASFHARSNR